MDRFEAMRIFCTVIEAGGFAAAADRLGLSTTAVSRHVAQLESRLGVRLLNRTTRRMSPTADGFAYFERCTQLLADLDETEASVSGQARRLHGRLRLTAPIALAVLRLGPAFATFAREHPEIELDIVLSDGIADFAEEGLDLALRVGKVGSTNVVARQIGETELLVAASPDYLARAGVPQRPEELSDHACFTYAYSSTGNQWQFFSGGETDGEPVNVRIRGPINANNGLLIGEMAASGAGIAMAPCFILAPLIKSGRLQRVLQEWPLRRLPIQVVYPARRHLSARVQAMAGFLARWYAEHGGVD